MSGLSGAGIGGGGQSGAGRSPRTGERYRLWPWFGAILLVGVGLPAVVARAGLVINEFLPDPAGSDGGREFVEFLNTGPQYVDLEQVEFQFANGSVGPEWTVRWRGTGLGTLAPGARFLLVDRNWQGPELADAAAYLGLQNGPDAIRIVQGEAVLDLVGYGPLTDPELFEGGPAAVASGLSLARRPDGRDSDDNGADFVQTGPTPGGLNFRPYSARLNSLLWEPPVLERPGDSLRLEIFIANDGTETLPGGPCRLVWPAGSVGAWWDGTPPDQARQLAFQLRPATRGPVALWWEYPVPDRPDTLRVPLATIQVGAAELRLNEILAVPDQGQGEWVEITWQGATPADLGGYRLRDQDGSWIELPGGVLAPGEPLVVAQDSLALTEWLRANGTAGGGDCRGPGAAVRIRSLPSWPTLNNTAPPDRAYADRVFLADSLGTIIDAVTWGGAGHVTPARGLSLERIGAEPVNPGAANWAVCTARAGSTPGCPNSVAATWEVSRPGPGLRAVPPILDRQAGATALHLVFVLQAPAAGWDLRIFDLWGALVRDYGGEDRGPGPRDLLWDGRDDGGRRVGPGAYLAWLETRTASGAVADRRTIRLVVR